MSSSSDDTPASSPSSASSRAPAGNDETHQLLDALVVGAGPAGIAAALTLQRAGRRVVVVDKATFPRDKFCGDGLTTLALRLLDDLGLDPDLVDSWAPVHDVLVTSPNGNRVTFPLPSGQGAFGAVAKRIDLDMSLVDLARTSGVVVHDGHSCTAIETAGDHLEVAVEGLGVLSTRFVVAADGMWSPTRKMLGVATPGYLGEWHAFRQYFTNVGPAAADNLHVWFEPDLLPGYAWSFPLSGGRANVGFGILRGGQVATREMKALWPELLSRPHIAAVLGDAAQPESPHRAWPIPARIDKIQLVTGRTLFVGDAAAATDPMTGEGIGQALLTGIRAGEAIAAGGSPASVGSRYAGEVRAELVADHHLATALSSVLQGTKRTDAAVRIAGATPWTRRNFARWLFEDYPRAILVTPRRWRRKVFTSRGAFERH